MCGVCRRSVLAGRVRAVCCVRGGYVHGVGGIGQLRLLCRGAVQQRQCLYWMQHLSRRAVRLVYYCNLSFCTAIVSDVAEGKIIHFRADSEAVADAARMCRVCVRYSTATAASSCVVCVAGQYSPGGISPCAACSAGYYSSSSGTAVCSACAAGRFAATAGLATCATCTGGQYVRFDSRVPGDYCPTPCSSC